MPWNTFINGQVDEDGVINGVARIIYDGGRIEEGQFEESVLNGFGRKILRGGAIQVGWFTDDELNGYGYKILVDGTIQKGIFEFGRIAPTQNAETFRDQKFNIEDYVLNQEAILLNP